MTYRLAIFDFDGTLADSFPFFLGVFNTIADRHAFRRIDVARAGELRHLGVRQMMDHVGMPARKLPLASKTFMAMMQDSAHAISLFDGIADALRHLHDRGVLLTVVSSNAEHNVRAVLGPELAALVARFDCGMSVFGKASRIRAVLKACGVAPRDALYIGDQATDAEAAQGRRRIRGRALGLRHHRGAACAGLRHRVRDAGRLAPDHLRLLTR
ncbi:MAG: HAD hydrolase-like protein [Massilia sp.]